MTCPSDNILDSAKAVPFFVSDGVAQPLQRLKLRSDFLATAKGRYFRADALVLQAKKRILPSDNAVRVGFTCSKKVGNAVARNRAKRRLREAARICLTQLGRPGWDYVLIGRAQKTQRVSFDELLSDLRKSIGKVHAGSSK